MAQQSSDKAVGSIRGCISPAARAAFDAINIRFSTAWPPPRWARPQQREWWPDTERREGENGTQWRKGGAGDWGAQGEVELTRGIKGNILLRLILVNGT